MGKEHKASIDGDQWAQCVREHGWLWDVATGTTSGEPVTLILAHGAGAESRQQIGWVIVGGMSVGTLLTIFVVPTMYALLARQRVPGAKTTPVEAPHAEPAHGA